MRILVLIAMCFLSFVGGGYIAGMFLEESFSERILKFMCVLLQYLSIYFLWKLL